MANKAILLIRVSSERQDYEAQTDELVQFAKSFGYADKDLILIQDKESAIKLSEEERQGLNKLKEAVNDNPDNISAVFCWELSRLSRQPKILYSIRDFLLERKINLIVKEPYLKLLDDNKEPISTSLIQFGFFIALVENEMRDKKARFDRGRKNKASQGKYTGGYIRYGYTIDPITKAYTINEDDAHIIKLVYNLYETGKYSHRTIVTELKELGYGNDVANIGKVQNILNSEEYAGETSKKKLKISFPPIITKEQFEKCREISDGNNYKINKSVNNIYYSQLLLQCSCCEKNLHPKNGANLYGCPDRSALSNYTLDTQIVKCADQNYVSMNHMDSLMWYTAKQWEALSIYNATEEQIKENDIKISDYQNKSKSIESRFNDLKKRRSRLGLSFADGMIDEDAYTKRKQDLNDEENNIFQDKLLYINEIERLENSNKTINESIIKLSEIETKGELIDALDYIELIIKSQIDVITDDKLRYDLIRKNIDKVVVKKVNDKTKMLFVKGFNNGISINSVIYIYHKKSKNTKPIIYAPSITDNFRSWGDIDTLCVDKNIIQLEIVRDFKAKPSLGQYEKVKQRMEKDPEYAERKKKSRYYYSKVWKINNHPTYTEEEKEEKIKIYTERYKEYL